MRDAPEYAKKYEKKFYDCMFRNGTGMDICSQNFNDVIRSIYRNEPGELNDKY